MAEKEKDNDIETEIPEIIPVLPVRDIVVFPYMIIPLFVGGKCRLRRSNRPLLKTG